MHITLVYHCRRINVLSVIDVHGIAAGEPDHVVQVLAYYTGISR